MKKNLDTIFNVVLGTAGHIDHGKSSLVLRLTGVDPDRLPEEKSRGLTIDLGFAPLVLRDGRRVGIIDVPGHERLIKNMVAGATGIDLVLLVVAADDGVMPQTREHLTIMEVLGIRHGLVAITKVDLVDGDLRELVREEISETLSGTFLEGAPVLEVSSVTGEGVDGLREAIFDILSQVRPRETGGIFRMPVQRVFSPKGFGTVITGVPVSGETKVGDTLEVVPLGKRGRVRGLHAYKEATDLARAGHSTAINVTDLDYREVSRGMVLAEPGYFKGSTMFEAGFRYLPSSRQPLEHQARIRLHTGTAEALGRIYLLEKKRLEAGEDTFVQFRMDEPVVVAPGDRYVLRRYSPMETIGGGEVLDRSRWRLKLGKTFVIEELRGKRAALGDPRRHLMHLVESAGYGTVTEKELAVRSGRTREEVRENLESLIGDGKVDKAGRAGQYVSTRRLEEADRRMHEAASSYYREHPRRRLMDKTYVRQALKCNDVFLQKLLESLEAGGAVETVEGGQIRWRDYGPKLTENEEAMREEISSRCLEGMFTPPSPDEIAAENGWEAAQTADLYDLLVEDGLLIKVADGIFFHRDAVDEARRRLREYLEKEGSVTAADAKKLLASTRKYGIPLLEFLDRDGFTVRKGDVRVLKQPQGSR